MKKIVFFMMALAVCMACSAGPIWADFAENNKNSAPGPLLTLEKAKALALEKSPTIASARERVNQALENIIQAKSSRMPSVDLSGSMDHREDSSGVSAAGYTTDLSATWLLFSGFKTRYTILSAEFGEKESSAAKKAADSLLLWSVASGYQNVQLALENIRIAESDKAYNSQLAGEAMARERFGTGSLSDVLNFQTLVNNAESDRMAAELEYKTACNSLAALMGISGAALPAGIRFEPIKNTEEGLPAIPAVEDAVSLALRLSPELYQERMAVQRKKAEVGVAKSGFYPVVSLYGTMAANEPEDTGMDSDDFNESVGVKFSMNLFSGGKTRSEVREAEYGRKEAEHGLKEKRLSLISEVRTDVDKLIVAEKQLSLKIDNTAMFEKTRDLVEKEYRAGQVSLVRMNEAQNNLVAAEGALAKARVELVSAWERLNYHTGKNLDIKGAGSAEQLTSAGTNRQL